MNKLVHIILLIIISFLFINSCKPITDNINRKIIKKNQQSDNNDLSNKKDFPFYLIGESYFIEDIEYIPQEDYKYDKKGTAIIFNNDNHGNKSSNNEIINITELIAFHKTLPIPSVIKITNLENDTALIVRIISRGPIDNSNIISVSSRVAELLNFLDKKSVKVRVQIMEEESKQLKVVSNSINNQNSTESITAAPTNEVKIESID